MEADQTQNQTQPQPQQIVTEEPKKSSSMPIIIIVILLLVAGVYYFRTNPVSTTPIEETVVMDSEPVVESEAVEASGQVVELMVVAGNFKYDKTEIVANLGDTVRITFKNDEGMHDFVLDEFGVKTSVIKAGEIEVVEFVADKAGTFEYYCSVGSHREMGMVGSLVVQEVSP